MQIYEIVLLAIAAVIAFMVVMRVLRTIFKIIFIVAILGALYYFFSGRQTVVEGLDSGAESMFRNTAITELMNKHCDTPEKSESPRCKCMIVPAYNDYTTRISQWERSAVEQDRTRLLKETWTSFANTRGSITGCAQEKKEQSVRVFEKIRELWNLLAG